MLCRRTLPVVVSMPLPATPAATLTRPASLAFSPPITSSRSWGPSFFFLTYFHRPFPLHRFEPDSVPDPILVPRAPARVLSFDRSHPVASLIVWIDSKHSSLCESRLTGYRSHSSDIFRSLSLASNSHSSHSWGATAIPHLSLSPSTFPFAAPHSTALYPLYSSLHCRPQPPT